MKIYVAAMVRLEPRRDEDGVPLRYVYPLKTGKLYTLSEAEAIVAKLQKYCQVELKVLDYDRFVSYNTYSHKEI